MAPVQELEMGMFSIGSSGKKFELPLENKEDTTALTLQHNHKPTTLAANLSLKPTPNPKTLTVTLSLRLPLTS